MRLPHFVGPSYVSQSPLADQEDLINLYPERMESAGATVQWALYPTPGFETITTATTAPGSAHFAQNEREFAIIGNQFIEISSSGAQTVRGTVAIDSNPGTISSNGDGGGQLFITSGGNGYNYDLTTDTLSAIAALAGKATMGDYLDGYFLALDAATSTMYISDLLDGTTWDPTQFAQRSIGSDNWVSLRVSNRYIYLLGSQTSEVWYNAGTSPFPFEPHPSGLMQWGCAAPFSPEIVTGTLVWLAATANGQGTVLRTAGFTPEPISTDPLQVALNGYSTIADGIGDTYDDLGHTFYIMTFPNANATWAWDAESGLWHKRGTWNPTQNRYDAMRALYHVFAFGEHRMLDRSSANLLRMSSTLGTDVDDMELRRMRRAPALVYENRRLYYALFELYLEPGLGVQSGQGSDPQVMLRASNDGGKTWGPELWRSAGAVGEYGKRQRWLRCGSGRKRVFEITVSDPIPWRIMDAFIEIDDAPQALRRAG